MKDGLVLMYVKDDVIYPVAMTQEQLDTFNLLMHGLPQPIKVIGNMPIGKAINLLEEK